MPSIHIYRRTRKSKDASGRTVVTTDKVYSAQIRFHGDRPRNYLRSTGKTSEREARIEARRIARELEDLPQQEEERKLTIDTLFGTWFKERGHKLKSQKDIKWLMKLISEKLGKTKPVAEIGNKEVHRFVQDLMEEGASGIVINRALTRLRATMNYAVDKWESTIKPIRWGEHFLDEPNEREIHITYEEARALVEALPPHIRLAAAWSYYTGCRLNETKTLTWDRVHIDRHFAVVIAKSKKLDATRKVWLTAKAIAVLDAVSEGKERSGVVFNLENRRKHFEKARAIIGRRDFRWHDWRHMTATHSRIIAKPDAKLIARAIGDTPEAANRYMHVLDSEVIELLDQLPEILLVQKPVQGLLSSTAIQGGKQNDLDTTSVDS